MRQKLIKQKYSRGKHKTLTKQTDRDRCPLEVINHLCLQIGLYQQLFSYTSNGLSDSTQSPCFSPLWSESAITGFGTDFPLSTHDEMKYLSCPSDFLFSMINIISNTLYFNTSCLNIVCLFCQPQKKLNQLWWQC